MLKKILLVFILAVSSCSSVKFDLNSDVTQNLPPEVALEYIKHFNKSINDSGARHPDSEVCEYKLITMSAGDTGQRPYSDAKMYGYEANNFIYLFVEIENSGGVFTHKKVCQYHFSDRNKVKKAVTALKSLGIKLE